MIDRRISLLVVSALALVVLCLAWIGVSAAAKHCPKPQPSRVCFPQAKWGPAPERFRPCVQVLRVFEDGSFSYAVTDADGTERYTAGIGALDR